MLTEDDRRTRAAGPAPVQPGHPLGDPGRRVPVRDRVPDGVRYGSGSAARRRAGPGGPPTASHRSRAAAAGPAIGDRVHPSASRTRRLGREAPARTRRTPPGTRAATPRPHRGACSRPASTGRCRSRPAREHPPGRPGPGQPVPQVVRAALRPAAARPGPGRLAARSGRPPAGPPRTGRPGRPAASALRASLARRSVSRAVACRSCHHATAPPPASSSQHRRRQGRLHLPPLPLLGGLHLRPRPVHLRPPGPVLGVRPQPADRLGHLPGVPRPVGRLRRQAPLAQRHQLRLRPAAVQPGEGVVQLRPRRPAGGSTRPSRPTYGGWPVRTAHSTPPRPNTSVRSSSRSTAPIACSGGHVRRRAQQAAGLRRRVRAAGRADLGPERRRRRRPGRRVGPPGPSAPWPAPSP